MMAKVAAGKMSEVGVRVMSFNIRTAGAVGREDGRHEWARRRVAVLEIIDAFEPDIMGLQEVMPEQEADLRAGLEGYEGWSRPCQEDWPEEAQEAKWIGYRRNRFSRRTSGTFELSTTPDTFGGPAWDSKHHRWVEWVHLVDCVTDQPLFVFNTHFDNAGCDARLQSAALLRDRVATIAGNAPAVVLGDFNCDADNAEPHRVLTAPTAAAGLRDAWATLHPDASARPTHNGFGIRQEQPGRIDWVLHSPHLSPAFAEVPVVRFTHDDGTAGYPSDHEPVQVIFDFV